jgi:aspartyl protease family protein
MINGAPMRFIVDTGASFVSLGRGDALRAGIDFTKGEPAMMQTANGVVRAWKVRLDSVRVGDVTLRNVEGIVHGSDMPFALLGMSFLNRMEMRRDGMTLQLHQRY